MITNLIDSYFVSIYVQLFSVISSLHKDPYYTMLDLIICLKAKNIIGQVCPLHLVYIFLFYLEYIQVAICRLEFLNM